MYSKINNKVEDYVNFLVDEIKKYQKKHDDVLKQCDYDAIGMLIGIHIAKKLDESHNKTCENLLGFIIGNEVCSPKDVEETNNYMERINKKKNKTSEKIINTSPYLIKVKEQRGINGPEITKNIPAIYCRINKNSLKAEGYTEDSIETIYEINVNDEKASTKDVDIISLSEAIEKSSTYRSGK